jgi:hypothetical protein
MASAYEGSRRDGALAVSDRPPARRAAPDTLTFDVIEPAVPHPPTIPADIARVAQEQTAYCPDIVDQGVGTTTALAEQQIYSHKWFFWWD